MIGGGVVGTNAARMAAGLGANVTVLDVNHERMRYLDETLPANCTTLFSNPMSVREKLEVADLGVGAARSRCRGTEAHQTETSCS